MAEKAPLVGRSSELKLLEEELRRSAAGEFRSVLLVSDPGLGKTRLAADFLERNRRRRVGLSARAYPLGRTAPFSLWAESFESHLRGLPATEVERLCGGFLDDLAGLLHSVASAKGSVLQREIPRHRVFEGLAVLMANLARQAQLVVLLDDFHLADASSWEVLTYLSRNLAEARVLIIAAARAGQLADRPEGVEILHALEQQGALHRMNLTPLGSEAVSDLARAVLGHPPPGPLVRWLTNRSGGNPLFALELLQALLEEGGDLEAPELRYLPEGLAERVLSRLRLLEEPAIATLEILAVLGRRVEIADLIKFSDRPLERLGEILQGLVRSGLVVEEERGRYIGYEIAHPLVQETIYRGIGGARRRALHRLAGRTLHASGRLGEAAPHFSRSAEVGDPEAIEALRDAVRQAEKQDAYQEALLILNALVELLPKGDQRWLEIFDAMSWQAEWVVDHRADTQAALGVQAMKAIDALMQGSPDVGRRANVKFRLTSFLAWGPGDLEEAEAACREALQLFQRAGDDRGALLARNELGWIAAGGGNIKSMEAYAASVVEDARSAGERLVEMRALYALCFAKFFLGRLQEAEAVAERGVAMAREEERDYRLTMVLGALSWPKMFGGRIQNARGVLEQAKEMNPGWREANLVASETTLNFLAGNYASSVGMAEDSLDAMTGVLSRRLAFSMPAGALSAVEMGLLAQARRFLIAARTALGRRDWSVFSDFCSLAEAAVATREGRSGEVLPDLRRLASKMLGKDSLIVAALVLTDLAEIAASEGEDVVANEAARDLHAISRLVGATTYRGIAAIGSGWAALVCGGHDQAVAAAREAVDLLSKTGWQGYEGRAWYLLGRSLSESDRPGAVEALQKAADIFEACGACYRRDRALEALRRLGGAGRRAAGAVSGPESLTAREREVARLAAKGKTAQEIGEQLFIGRRTVETHLANAYAKLGVSSKMELVQRASELVL